MGEISPMELQGYSNKALDEKFEVEKQQVRKELRQWAKSGATEVYVHFLEFTEPRRIMKWLCSLGFTVEEYMTKCRVSWKENNNGQ